MSFQHRRNPDQCAAEETAKRLNSTPAMSDIDQDEQREQAEREEEAQRVAVLREAAELIAFIGTTGVERGDVLRRAQAWLKANYYETLL